LILATLMACAVEDQPATVPNVVTGCTVGADVPVEDDVAAEGMPFAPAEVAPLFGGEWAGTLAFPDGATADARFALGLLNGWSLRPRSGTADDGATCAPSYIVATWLALEDGSGRVEEDVAVEVETGSLWSVTLLGALALEDLQGTSRPTGWVPSVYDMNRLVVRASGEPLDVSGQPGGRGTWEVALTWTAWNEDAPAADTVAEFAGEGTFFPSDPD
jgi:hypothetical protein